MEKEIKKPSLEGLFCIDKPERITSFRVVDKIRRHLNVLKAGHTGTLDNMATGVLVICLGKATRIAEYLQTGTKIYNAKIHLGISTVTNDVEGMIIKKGSIGNIRLETVEEVLRKFIGKILQKPPSYSAIKKDGVRVYKLARAGINIELEPREVEIYNIEIKNFHLPFLEISAEVSPGTYIRSLARDIGNALSCGAHISELRRIKDGRITIDMCTPMDELLKMNKESVLSTKSFISINEALPDTPVVRIDKAGFERIRNGMSIDITDEIRPDGLYQAKYDGILIAIGTLRDNIFKPDKVLI
ncbi:MAG: tRNA pseudouridine(55) synthase TruB [bacterium]